MDPSGNEAKKTGDCRTQSDVSRDGAPDGKLAIDIDEIVAPAGAQYTGDVAAGLLHYMDGSGTLGFESIADNANLDQGLANTMSLSTMPDRLQPDGTKAPGTLVALAMNGGGVKDITVGLPSIFSEVAAGAVKLEGSASVLVGPQGDALAIGRLSGAAEQFDFNSNPNRGKVLNGIVSGAKVAAEVTDTVSDIFSPTGQTPTATFEQYYTGKVLFSYSWRIPE